MKTKQKPNLAILREMKVGELHSFPLAKLGTIKSCCTTFGLQWGKVFRTAINRQQGTIDVTRLS